MANQILTQEDDLRIKSEYLAGSTTDRLAKQFGVSKNAIRNRLLRQGISLRNSKEAHRKDFFNQAYFSNGVVSQNHAYILGLFFADGYNNEQRSSVKLDLKETDVDILEKIKLEMQSSASIKRYTNNTTHGKCKIARLQFVSDSLSADLAKLGCVQRKSFILTYPTIPDRYFFSFLLGYYDGDGSLTLTNTKYFDPCFSLVGTLAFCQEVKNKLALFDINSYLRQHKNVWYLRVKGTRQLDRLLTNMYMSSSLYLDRKYFNYLRYLEKVKKLNRKL